MELNIGTHYYLLKIANLVVICGIVYADCPTGFTDIAPNATAVFGNCIKVS